MLEKGLVAVCFRLELKRSKDKDSYNLQSSCSCLRWKASKLRSQVCFFLVWFGLLWVVCFVLHVFACFCFVLFCFFSCLCVLFFLLCLIVCLFAVAYFGIPPFRKSFGSRFAS